MNGSMKPTASRPGAAKNTGHALPLNPVRIWCPLRGHGAAALCRELAATSTARPRPIHAHELSANSPRPWSWAVRGPAAAKERKRLRTGLFQDRSAAV